MRSSVHVVFSSLCLLLLASMAAASGHPVGFEPPRELPAARVQCVRINSDAGGGESVPQGPRIAVLLIDCSNTMYKTRDQKLRHDGLKNPRRWEEVRKAVQESLENLQRASPGIDVRLEFFAGEYQCFPRIAERLVDAASVDRIMSNVPKDPPNKGRTVLYEAISRTLTSLLQEDAVRDFEWALFAVYSDGADDRSADEFQKQGARSFSTLIDRFKADVRGAEALARIVGDEVQKFSADGGFGALVPDGIGKGIPIPPKPRPVFELKLVQGPTDQGAASPGVYRIPIACTSAEGTLPQKLELSIASPGPFRLRSSEIELVNGRAVCELELGAGTDVDTGLSTMVRLSASGDPNGTASFVGSVDLPIRFAGTDARKPEDWKTFIPDHVKVGDGFRTSVDPGGTQGDPEWTFSLQGGQRSALTRKGFQPEVRLDAAGSWEVVVRATTPGGRQQESKLGTIPVIDSSFSVRAKGKSSDQPITTQRGSGDLELEIVRQGPSDADYTAMFDGKPIALDRQVSGTQPLRIESKALDAVGTRILTVQATSRVGGYSWKKDVPIEVSVAPGIEVLNATYAEGDEDATIAILVFGDVGDSVRATVGSDFAQSCPVEVDPKKPVQQRTISIPRRHIKSARTPFTVEPARRGSCNPISGTIDGVPANLELVMREPIDGTSIELGSSQAIRSSPRGDLERFGDSLEFEVVFLDSSRPGESPTTSESGLRAKAPDWAVALPPELPSGKVRIFARPVSPRLNAAAFPATSSWRQFGTLEIKPPIPTIELASGAGQISPGRPESFEVRMTGPASIADIEWSIGPLPNDSNHSNGPITTRERVPTRTFDACGELPVAATVTLAGGEKIPAQPRSFPIVAMPAKVNPALADRSVVKGQRSVGMRPGVEGDFRWFEVKLFRRGESASGVPVWTSQKFTSPQESVDLPLTGDEVAGLTDEFEVVVEIDQYPSKDVPIPPLVRSSPVLGEIVPPPAWHWWLACIAVLAAVGWYLGRLLFGNEPLRWRLEYLDHDPGEPDGGATTMARIFIKDPYRHRERPQSSYLGWSRRRKQALIPFWLLAARDEGTRWLENEAFANITVRITRNGLLRSALPNHACGWHDPTESIRRGCVRPNQEVVTPTWRLRHTVHGPPPIDRELYVRLVQAPGRDPYEWVFWAYVVIAVAAIAYLASVFHIV